MKSCPVWIGVLCAVVTTVLLGLEVAFNVYAVSIKQTFNFTQTEVELVSVSGLVGMGASLAEPFITGTFGYRIGYFMIWVTTSGSALMMWVAVIYKDFFTHWPSLICAIQFIMSMGQNAGSTRLTSISIHNLSKRHTGKVVGLGHAAIAAAKIVYGGLLQAFFEDNLGDFFLTVSIIFSVSVGLCSIVHRPQDRSDDECSPTTALLQTSRGGHDVIPESEKCSTNENTDAGDDDYDGDGNPVLTMTRATYFHLTFWPAVIIYSTMFTYMNNITSIAHSLDFDQPLYVLYLLSVTIVTGRLLFGLLFDNFKSELTGFLLLMTGSVSMVTGILLLVLQLGAVSLYIVTFLLGVGVSVGITIPASLLAVRFGQRNYPYIIGCLYSFTAFFCLIFQFLVGVLYDRRLAADGFCYGSYCFFLSSITLLIITVFCTSVQVLNFVKNGQTDSLKSCA